MNPARPVVALLYAPCLDFGGVETHLLSLLRDGRERIDFKLIGPMSERFREKVDLFGIQTCEWRLRRTLPDIGAVIDLARLLRREQAALLHIHSPAAGLAGRMAALLAGIPVVATVHLPVEEYEYQPSPAGARWRGRLAAWLERLLNRHFTQRLIYVSAAAYEKALARGGCLPERSTLIPNGIELEIYAARPGRDDVRARWSLPPTTCIAVFCGRLERQKGLETLLAAFGGLSGETQLWLVGEGSLRPALEQAVKQAGLQDRVRFWGYRSDVADLLAASDLFVLPSRFEGMSLALLEAQAAGLPCIVTAVGENARLVEDGVNGLVVPAGDVESLREALAQLAGSPDRRRKMGENAADRGRAFDARLMVKRIEDVYEAEIHRFYGVNVPNSRAAV